MADSADLILDEARRRFDSQSARYDDLRARATGLLGAAAVITGVFGFSLSGRRTALDRVMLLIALGSFVAVVVLTVLINRPAGRDRGRRWMTGDKLDQWIPWSALDGATGAVFATQYGTSLNEARFANEKILKVRFWQFEALCLCLGLQVVAWSIAVMV